MFIRIEIYEKQHKDTANAVSTLFDSLGAWRRTVAAQEKLGCLVRVFSFDDVKLYETEAI